jgi:hypothetical protein
LGEGRCKQGASPSQKHYGQQPPGHQP